MLGVNTIAKREVRQHYISVCGLSLAWVTSENSTKQLECHHLLTQSSSLGPVLSPTVSGVDRICPWFHANSLCCPAANSSLFLFPANSHSRPPTTSGYGEISGPRILCLVSRQNRQRIRLPWRETHIVLHTTPSCPCHLFTINYNTIHRQSKQTKTFTGSNNQNNKILKGFGRPPKKIINNITT